MPAPAPALPQPPLLPPPAVSANDPINTVDITWLRRRAGELIADLISALPADSQQRVAGLPLVFDNTPGEVNAFAACDKGRALMAVTDELLRISAYLAQAEATDERFASHKVDQVIQYIATHQRQNQPLATPSGGFFDSRQSADPTKTARQHQVFDEQLAFVLGHELGHHYLGHLGCTAKPDPLGAGDIARVLSGSVPLFNQPNELAADVAGTNNVLSAGARHTGGYAYTENGALLTMRFFQGLHDAAGAPMFDFEASHPSPAIRIPVIQQAAAAWRFTGGRGITLPHLGG
jgi:hypothetical protein